MPMYVMNIFMLPDTLIDDIHIALNCFWWGDGIKANPIQWCSWDKMCFSKFRGGLSFRHFGVFNRSLLAKQVWRLITNPTTLAAKVLKARYFPRSSFFDANVSYRPSYVWRSFIAVKELVRKGCKWNIGDGHRVNMWEDYWLEDHRRMGPKPDNCKVTYVRDLLNDEGDDWNRELLMSFSRGLFSSKSAYYLELESSQHIVQNVSEESTKAICNAKMGEDMIHVLFKCPSTKQIWDRCNFGRFYDMDGMITLDDFCHVILNKFPMAWENFLMILWGLWTRRNKRRNKKFHGQLNEKDANVEVMSKLLLMDYHKANQQQPTTIQLKSSPLGLVNALQRGTTLLQIASIFAQIVSNSSSFSSCNWSFVKREGNKVAHSIATWALSCSDELILEGSVSECASDDSGGKEESNPSSSCLKKTQKVKKRIIKERKKERKKDVARILSTREDHGLVEFADLEQLDNPDMHVDSVRMMNLFHKIKEVIAALDCPRQFNLKDIVKPEADRTQLFLSAILNFCIHREYRMNILRPIVGEFDVLDAQGKELDERIKQLNDELSELNEAKEREMPFVQEIETKIKEMQQEITALNNQQHSLKITIRNRREESMEMDQKISSAEFALVQTTQENGSLCSKIVQSPDKLQRTLEERKIAQVEAKNAERAAMQSFHEQTATDEVYTK
ncbi:reverse transcriptase, partial [Tanacetum coccineum]